MVLIHDIATVTRDSMPAMPGSSAFKIQVLLSCLKLPLRVQITVATLAVPSDFFLEEIIDELTEESFKLGVLNMFSGARQSSTCSFFCLPNVNPVDMIYHCDICMTRIGRVTVAFWGRCHNCTTFWKLNVFRPAAARVEWNAKCLEPRFCFLIFLDLVDIQKLAHDRTTPYTVSCLALS